MRRSLQGATPTGRRSGAGGETTAPAAPELPGLDPDVDPEELRDFMSADWLEVKADPGFRERLRNQLWKMLRASQDGEEPDDDER